MVKETDYMISDQEILGGLRAAIERGSTLKQAMMSFYQAGYDKSEIEDAARAYMNQQRNEDMQLNPAQIVQKTEIKKEEEKKEDTKKVNQGSQNNIQKIPSAPVGPSGLSQGSSMEAIPQKVSSYDMPKKKEVKAPKSNILTFILIFVLLFLVGVLFAVYMFKEELVQFINSMFG